MSVLAGSSGGTRPLRHLVAGLWADSIRTTVRAPAGAISDSTPSDHH